MFIQVNPFSVTHQPYQLIIGNGRLAKHLIYYFQLLKCPTQQWSRKKNSAAELTVLASSAEHIWLCVSDDSIELFIKNLSSFQSKIIQCSGTLHFDGVINLHPLASFGNDLYIADFYPQIFWISSSPNKLNIPLLEKQILSIDVKYKSLYHALCVLTGPGTSLLWQNFIDELLKIDLPKEAATAYFASLWLNYSARKTPQVTGPWVRGDLNTINSNQKALMGLSQCLSIYQELYSLFQAKNIN